MGRRSNGLRQLGARFEDNAVHRYLFFPGPMVLLRRVRIIAPTARYSDGPLFRRLIIVVHEKWSELSLQSGQN
jgi:hypothetical protein